LVADRRARPGDPAQDVLTRLIGTETDAERLSEAELLHNCIFILNAGHETTTNLIGNGLYLLLQWPDERRRLAADPTLIRTAVEEFLRFESSNQLGNRTASEVVELCIGAANRDPAYFSEPDRLDVGRQPNRHLAFAAGPHQCVGMTLARLEGRIAIGRFLARYPDYGMAGLPTRAPRARFRGFLRLPVLL
jgi:cytochrome P450